MHEDTHTLDAHVFALAITNNCPQPRATRHPGSTVVTHKSNPRKPSQMFYSRSKPETKITNGQSLRKTFPTNFKLRKHETLVLAY